MGDPIGTVKLNVLLQTNGSWMKGMKSGSCAMIGEFWSNLLGWQVVQRGACKAMCIQQCKASEGSSWVSPVLGMGASFGQE